MVRPLPTNQYNRLAIVVKRFLDHLKKDVPLDSEKSRELGIDIILKERKAMMQQWADYLDKIKVGADVIPLQLNKA